VNTSIDWRGLADRLGTITWNESGRSESGGTAIACDAIVEILGDAALCDAVDFYVSGQPGNEVARSVLMLLKPAAAMERCREIFRAPADEQEAADAINLLKMVADRRVLDWIPEFMQSDNSGVKIWALGILDQLLVMQESITPEEAMPFFKQALADPSKSVRDQATQFLDDFADNEQVIAMRALMP
jgi:HEAT repeat protein